MKLNALALALTFLVAKIHAAHGDQIVMYYGQNSAQGKGTQKRLSYYCESDAMDIAILSFMNVFPDNLSVNFGPACEPTPDNKINGTDLLSCPQLGEDIKKCQSMGKKVLLSLGGASGSYGFGQGGGDAKAKEFADTLWSLFGRGKGKSNDERPFGDAILDGFDLDIEAGGKGGYAAMVTRLRELYAGDPSRDYHVAAAPQCVLPDAYLSDALENSDIDMVYIQFYNNFCGMQNYGTDHFNYKDWNDYVKNKMYNKKAKLYLGVPASQSAAGQGYVPADKVIKASHDISSKFCDNFGGVMMWDASQAWANDDFAGKVKKGLKNNKCGNKGEPKKSSSANESSEAPQTPGQKQKQAQTNRPDIPSGWPSMISTPANWPYTGSRQNAPLQSTAKQAQSQWHQPQQQTAQQRQQEQQHPGQWHPNTAGAAAQTAAQNWLQARGEEVGTTLERRASSWVSASLGNLFGV